MTSYSEWALAQIEGNKLAQAGEPRMAYEELAKSLVAVCGGSGQLFGLGLGNFDADALPAIRGAIVCALCEYKAHYEAEAMLSWLFELDGIAKRFAIDELRLTKRFPLRCDPLGARDGLSTPWQTRLGRLDAACAGTARLDLAAVDLQGDPTVRFGARDDDALYREAVRFENAARATFPRELAAWWSTANGISIGDTPLLAPVREWREDELGEVEGLRIGSGGGYSQGSMFLVGDLTDGIEHVRLVVTDDEVVTREYKTFGEFADRLLGSA